MNNGKYTREAAWALLTEYTQSASLLKHALAVETCVRAYGEAEAIKGGLAQEEARELIETYSVTGLLHDFDYEKYPTAEEHPFTGNRIFEGAGMVGRDSRGHYGPCRVLRRSPELAFG